MKDEDEEVALRMLADSILLESRSKQSERILSATGFSTNNISILHQQVRCTNLAWALDYREKLPAGTVIGIVGASFSGLMLACALAIPSKVIVYIFEKEDRMMPQFRDKGHRFVGPNLNSRDLPPRFSAINTRAFFKPPIFEWIEDSAADVANRWIREFLGYYEKLPIFCCFKREITRDSISCSADKVLVRSLPTVETEVANIELDLLIDATGFGTEANPLGLDDYSYWSSGHPLLYRYLRAKDRILISGAGDSGAVELMHYAFKDFTHATLPAYFPPGSGIESHISRWLGGCSFKAIRFHPDTNNRFNEKLISELCWYVDNAWYAKEMDTDPGWSKELKALYWDMDKWVGAYVRKHADVRHKNFNAKGKHFGKSYEYLEDILITIPKVQQMRFRKQFDRSIRSLASQEIADFMAILTIENFYHMAQFSELYRPDVRIVMNADTPTAFSMNMSPFNMWVVHLALQSPCVSYERGRIKNVVKTKLRFEVTFESGKRKNFDHVVSRYGAVRNTSQALLQRYRRTIGNGDWLLTSPIVQRTTSRANFSKTVDLACERILAAKSLLAQRVDAPGADLIEKTRYSLCIGIPASWNLHTDKYADPQRWLVDRLRSGARTTYQKGKVENLFTFR